MVTLYEWKMNGKSEHEIFSSLHEMVMAQPPINPKT